MITAGSTNDYLLIICFAVILRAIPQVHNLQNEITKKCAPPCATTDAVFYAGTGLLLCRSEDKVRVHTRMLGCLHHCWVHHAAACSPAAGPVSANRGMSTCSSFSADLACTALQLSTTCARR